MQFLYTRLAARDFPWFLPIRDWELSPLFANNRPNFFQFSSPPACACQISWKWLTVVQCSTWEKPIIMTDSIERRDFLHTSTDMLCRLLIGQGYRFPEQFHTSSFLFTTPRQIRNVEQMHKILVFLVFACSWSRWSNICLLSFLCAWGCNIVWPSTNMATLKEIFHWFFWPVTTPICFVNSHSLVFITSWLFVSGLRIIAMISHFMLLQ